MDPLKYIVPGRKRLPYGMMNFADIRQDNYYYVDKTRFIPMIEEADRFFFFIRPRRFGKSLTLNLLRQYYDVRTRDKFEALFGDLYIGQHPTPSRNSYLVLYLNFSGITSELNDYRKGLDAHCQIRFDFFCEVYSDLLPQGIRERLDEKDGAVKAGQKATPVVTKSNQTARVSGKSLTYKVQSGDSLYSIAKKYPGVSTDDLQRANGLTSADIRPGQVLKIPVV